MSSKWYSYPIKPRSDNFTPTERTPWGGKKIAAFKSHLGVKPDQIIGESWEISGHKDFPSRFLINGKEWTLLELAAKDPEAFFGKENVERFGKQMPFLAKLLNAEDWLSVQVHPKPDYKGLKSGEHSKTEAWYIIEAEEGSGIYLGLKEGVTSEVMQKDLTAGHDITQHLYFVPVKAGDVYFVPAGTPHAIGPGILLFEPQETSATTYRYYDFGRKNSQGESRLLHIEDSLAATDWKEVREDSLIQKLRQGPKKLKEGEGFLVESLLSKPEFNLVRFKISKGKSVNESSSNAIQGLTVLEGSIVLESPQKDFSISVSKGESVIILAAVGDYQITGSVQTSVFLKTEAGT